jgi:fucose 4-O-acetylase-like acetyltransferase
MRDNRIDILRFIGLAMIMLAHVHPPSILFHLRNFDVPLMVLVSGMSFGLSYKAGASYMLYVWKRIKRLVFPVWFFLSGYYTVKYLLSSGGAPELYTVFEAYLFIGGDYLWIIRVFLLVALVAPAIYLYDRHASSTVGYFFTLAALFSGYEVLRFVSQPYVQSGIGHSLSLVFHYIIPYSILFALGLRIPSLTQAQIGRIIFTSIALFILIGLGMLLSLGTILPTQQFKYPPSIYYFSYAIVVSLMLWLLGEKIESVLNHLGLLGPVLFVGKNSIWIYLWHIPLVELVHTNFVLKYIIVFSISAILTWIQVWIVDRVITRHISDPVKNKNIRMLLTG